MTTAVALQSTQLIVGGVAGDLCTNTVTCPTDSSGQYRLHTSEIHQGRPTSSHFWTLILYRCTSTTSDQITTS
jgi:hypothetical protein